jgi:CrcB protein
VDTVVAEMTTDEWADGGDRRGLPVDPDIDVDQTPDPTLPAGLPRIAPCVVLAVFVGGIFGGLARYGIGRAAPPAPAGFPWDIFAINLSGAFALAVLLVTVVEILPPTTYVRPALGTGFLGAFTTFSSLAVAADHLAAHGHPSVAALYVVASVVGGLIAAQLGLSLGRTVARSRSAQSAGQD